MFGIYVLLDVVINNEFASSATSGVNTVLSVLVIDNELDASAYFVESIPSTKIVAVILPTIMFVKLLTLSAAQLVTDSNSTTLASDDVCVIIAPAFAVILPLSVSMV